MNVITSFFISAFILRINSLNIGRETMTPSSSKHKTPSLYDEEGGDSPETFQRTNVVSIKQSALDEIMLQYPTNDFDDDMRSTTGTGLPKNSFQMIIEQAKTKTEKRFLSTLSIRYSSAINNERVSEIKSLLTSTHEHHRHLLSGEGYGGEDGGGGGNGRGGGAGNYRKNFIVDCERVRDLSDRELMVIINRMVEDKKVVSPLG
jgi:hypothetical protein